MPASSAQRSASLFTSRTTNVSFESTACSLPRKRPVERMRSDRYDADPAVGAEKHRQIGWVAGKDRTGSSRQRLSDDERVNCGVRPGFTQEPTGSTGGRFVEKAHTVRRTDDKIDRSISWPRTTDGFGNDGRRYEHLDPTDPCLLEPAPHCSVATRDLDHGTRVEHRTTIRRHRRLSRHRPHLSSHRAVQRDCPPAPRLRASIAESFAGP